jgi:hypothetical protein
MKHLQIKSVSHKPAKGEFIVKFVVKAEDIAQDELAVLCAGENDGTGVSATFTVDQ